MSEEYYEIKDDVLYIIDAKLKLNINCPFQATNKKVYYENGKIKADLFFKKILFHGKQTYFSECGAIVAEIWYKDGKKQGRAYQYYLSGKIFALNSYVDDLMQFSQYYYYSNGNLKSLLNYKNGIPDGYQHLFWENGYLKRESRYLKGKMTVNYPCLKAEACKVTYNEMGTKVLCKS